MDADEARLGLSLSTSDLRPSASFPFGGALRCHQVSEGRASARNLDDLITWPELQLAGLGGVQGYMALHRYLPRLVSSLGYGQVKHVQHPSMETTRDRW